MLGYLGGQPIAYPFEDLSYYFLHMYFAYLPLQCSSKALLFDEDEVIRNERDNYFDYNN
jgi:hypothetical protein